MDFLAPWVVLVFIVCLTRGQFITRVRYYGIKMCKTRCLVLGSCVAVQYDVEKLACNIFNVKKIPTGLMVTYDKANVTGVNNGVNVENTCPKGTASIINRHLDHICLLEIPIIGEQNAIRKPKDGDITLPQCEFSDLQELPNISTIPFTKTTISGTRRKEQERNRKCKVFDSLFVCKIHFIPMKKQHDVILLVLKLTWASYMNDFKFRIYVSPKQRNYESKYNWNITYVIQGSAVTATIIPETCTPLLWSLKQKGLARFGFLLDFSHNILFTASIDGAIYDIKTASVGLKTQRKMPYFHIHHPPEAKANINFPTPSKKQKKSLVKQIKPWKQSILQSFMKYKLEG